MNATNGGSEKATPLVVHVHMPKAGGTTLDGLLQSIYGDRLLIAHPIVGWPQQWTSEFIAHVAEKREYYEAFSGHSSYGIHQLFGREGLYISSVRDPVDRFESYYNFVRHWTLHHHHEVARNLSIQEFFRYLRDRDDIELFNLQCLLLCGRKDFKAAREFIIGNYSAILPIKYFNECMRLLTRKMRWPAIAVPRLNATEHRSKVTELSPGDMRTLIDGNREDLQLVKFCEANANIWFDA